MSGRPSKYQQAYCNEVIECLAQGHSITAFAGTIGVARSSIFKWAEENEEFSDAIKVGQAKAVLFWEKKLTTMGAKDNVTAVIFGLKNRARDEWSDRVISELTGPDGGPIKVEDVAATAKAIASKLARLAPEDEAASVPGQPDAGGTGIP